MGNEISSQQEDELHAKKTRLVAGFDEPQNTITLEDEDSEEAIKKLADLEFNKEIQLNSSVEN